MSLTIKKAANDRKKSSQKTVKNVGFKKRRKNPNLSNPVQRMEKVFCRLCLGIINDYPAHIWETGLSEDILLCCAIEVSPSDSYTHLCPSCLNNLKQCVQFRLMCSKNNCIYLQLKTVKVEESSVTFDKSTEISEVNIKTHSAVKRNALKKEIKLEIENVPKISTADGAGYELEIIFKKENTDDDSVPNDDSFNASDYENADLEGNHAEEADLREKPKELACLKCPVICVDEQEYEVHCESHKPVRDPQGFYVLCKLDGCKEKFKTVRDRKAHMQEKHGASGPLHLCYVCGGMVRYYSSHLYMTHKGRKELQEKVPAKCELCTKEYPNSFRLQQHTKAVHKSSGCVCPICGNTVKTKIRLNKHMQEVHFQTDKYSCLYCDKKSGNAYNMRVHMRTHTGELPFACPDCSLQFSHRVTMKQHRLQVHHVDMFQRPPPTTLAFSSSPSSTKRPKKYIKL